MRKVTEGMVNALKAGRDYANGNTVVIGNAVSLFGHHIATVRADVVWVSSCGWHSATTKDRLNAILRAFCDDQLYNKKWRWFLNDGRPFYDEMLCARVK